MNQAQKIKSCPHCGGKVVGHFPYDNQVCNEINLCTKCYKNLGIREWYHPRSLRRERTGVKDFWKGLKDKNGNLIKRK